MKNNRQISQKEFEKLSLLPKEEWYLLWHDDYWDGPLSGMLKYNGEFLYFAAYKPRSGEQGSRAFTVHRLIPEVLSLQIRWHKLFRDLVGTHCDYDPDGGQLGCFDSKINPKWESFYDLKRTEYDPIEPELGDSTTEVVGWIEF